MMGPNQHGLVKIGNFGGQVRSISENIWLRLVDMDNFRKYSLLELKRFRGLSDETAVILEGIDDGGSALAMFSRFL